MRGLRGSRAATGLFLIVLGAWGALIPFIGSYFDWVIGSDETWDWTAGRFWLSVLPGVVTVVAGLMLMASARRPDLGRGAALAGVMAICAGAWFVVGPEVSRLWNDGVSEAGRALGGTTQQVFENLTYFLALGVAIATLGALALGRLSLSMGSRFDSARSDDYEYDDDALAEGEEVSDRRSIAAERGHPRRGMRRRRGSGRVGGR